MALSLVPSHLAAAIGEQRDHSLPTVTRCVRNMPPSSVDTARRPHAIERLTPLAPARDVCMHRVRLAEWFQESFTAIPDADVDESEVTGIQQC